MRIPFRTVVSRQRLDLAALRPEQVDLRDIVRGLSLCCRFACQMREFYSVLQHSLLVSTLVPLELEPHARLHDASEAYLGDLTYHLKHHPGLSGYRLIETQISEVIRIAMKLRVLTPEESTLLKAADDLAAIYEHWVLREARVWAPVEAIRWAIDDGFSAGDEHAMLKRAIFLPRGYRAWSPAVAEQMFLRAHTGQQRMPLNVWEITDEA